jgi:glutamyl-tRNA reductase
MHLIAAGVSFHTAPLSVRERAVVEDDRAATVLRYLVGHAGLSAAAVLSTCNRTEFYLVTPDDDVAADVLPRLAGYLNAEAQDAEDVEPYMEGHHDDAALRHIFRVAAGLESMMVGENQVLGQFKRAHRLALEAGCLDARLDFILRRALSLGKKVRSQGLLGAATLGLADAATGFVTQKLGSLQGRSAVVVGSGHTAADVAKLLVEAGARLVVAARGQSGVELANRYQGRFVAIDELGGLDDIDAIISCTSSSRPVVSFETVDEIQRHRGGAPLVVVDLAVPRDVDAEVENVAGVVLVDVDSVNGSVPMGIRDVTLAEAEIEKQTVATASVLRERETAGQAIAAIGQWAEAIRSGEVERAVEQMPGLTDDQKERMVALSKALVKRLLHSPIAALREAGDDPQLALSLLQAFDVAAGEQSKVATPPG